MKQEKPRDNELHGIHEVLADCFGKTRSPHKRSSVLHEAKECCCHDEKEGDQEERKCPGQVPREPFAALLSHPPQNDREE